MEDIEFASTLRLPEIRFGAGRASELAEVVRGFGRRALIVARGRSFVEGEDWARLSGQLRTAGIECELESVSGEPSPDVVDGIVARARERARTGVPSDVVVGIGGGSVMDTAKAVAGLLLTGESVTQHLEGIPPNLPFVGPAVPFVAVPTTAGTGSEATKNSVISVRGEGGYKRSFRDDALIARVAIVDPDLLRSCPPGLIAANGMDALTQLLESYMSTRSNPVARQMAVHGLEAARDGFALWYDEAAAGRGGGQPAAPGRERMALAALCSGICLAQTGLGCVHGVASALGAQYPIPHGVACGATLAAGTRMNLMALESREPSSPALSDYSFLGRLMMRRQSASDVEARAGLVTKLERLREYLHVPGLSAYGLTEEGIPAVVADSRGSSMRTNPIALTDAEIAQLLRASL